MGSRQDRAARRAAKLLLALLLLVPLLARSHVHGARHVAAQPCPTCIVANHAPVNPSAPPSLAGPLLAAQLPRIREVASPAHATRSPYTVRAPPVASSRYA